MSAQPSPALLLPLTTALTTVAQRWASSPELPQSLIETLLQHAPTLSGAALYRRANGQVVRAAQAGQALRYPAEVALDRATVVGQVVLDGQIVADPAPPPDAGLSVLVPLLDAEGEAQGALGVHALESEALFGEMRGLLQVAAQLITLALGGQGATRDNLTRTSELLGEVNAQYDTSRRIVLASDPTEMLQALVDFVGEGCLYAELNRYEDPRLEEAPTCVQTLSCLIAGEPSPMDLVEDFAAHPSRPAYEALARGLPLIVPDVTGEAAFDAASQAYFAARAVRCLMFLPLMSEQLLVGQVVLGGASPETLDAARVRAYQSLADQMAITLENQHLLQRTSTALAEVQQAYSSARAVLNASSPAGMVEQLYRSLLYRPDHLTLHRFDYDVTGQLSRVDAVVVVSGDEVSASGESYYVPQDVGLGEYTARLAQGESVVSPHVTEDAALAEPARQALRNMSLVAVAAFPLRDADGLVRHVLAATYQEPHDYTESELRALQTVSDQAGVVLQNWELLEATRRKTIAVQEQMRIVRSLYEIGRSLSSALEIDVILGRAAENLYNALNVGQVDITLLAADGPLGAVETAYPALETLLAPDHPAVAMARQTRQPFSSDDVARDPRLAAVRDAMAARDVAALLVVPLLAGDDAIGSIALMVQGQAHSFTEDEVNVVQSVASQVAIAVQNATLFAEAQQANLVIKNSATVLFRWRAEEGLPVEFVSGNVTQLCGYSAEALLSGELWYTDIVHPDDREAALRETMTYRTRAVDRYVQTYRIVAKDGEVRWVEDETTVERDADGQITHLTGVVNDITAQKQAATALREARDELERRVEERTAELEAQRTFLRQVIDLNPNFIFAKDWDGRFTLVNQALADTYGTTVEQLIGKTEADFNPNPEEVERLLRDDRAVMTSGAPEFIPEAPITNAETGEVRWLQTIKVPLASPDGEVRQVLGVATDITARKQAEEELRESEERFRAVVENAQTGIFVINDTFQFTYVNDEICRIVGYDADELLGMDFRAVLTDESKQMVADRYIRRQRGEDVPPRYEFSIARKDGEVRQVEISSASGLDPEGRPRTLAQILDVTERKRLEQQVLASLERRGWEVQTATDVAQEIAAAPALDELFRRVVTLIKERFDYYHAQLFQTDPETGDQIMIEGYGEAGQAMKAAGHRIASGQGVVGAAASSQQPVLVADVNQSEGWLPNPYLPATRGELALPILLRGEVKGVLDVQSDEPGRLSEDDQLALLGLCGQIASAMESTQLLESLTQERNLMRALLDVLPDLIYAKDTESRFILGNARVARLMGASSPENLLGKTDFDFYSEDLAAQYYADEQALIRSGEALLDREEPLADQATGKTGWLLTSKVPLRDAEGHIWGFVGIGRDITERREAELERERLLAEVEKRATQLQTAAEASRAASSILDPDELLTQVVGLLRERFGLYYAGIFLVDEAREYAVLRAGTGEAGQKMLEARHRLLVGGESMIGRCVAERQARIALDVGTEAVRFDNPYLPDTRSEMALPLISRDRVLGAMTIQSAKEAAFGEEDIAALQTMADQVANAIQNARLFRQIQDHAAQEERLNAITAQLQQRADITVLLNAAVEELGQTLGARVGRVRLRVPDLPGAAPGGNGDGANGAGDVDSKGLS